jgi:archaellum component FlaG (FlaF/FlaG flagellin family)
MADGGASSFIMLITALLVSGSASAILISEWSDAARFMQTTERYNRYASEISVEFSGDPMMVTYDPNGASDDYIIFHVLNSGVHTLDSNYEVRIDGVSPDSISTSLFPGGTSWLPDYVLAVNVSDPSFNYVDGTDIKIYFLVNSKAVGGHVYSADFSTEVRLHEI